MARPLSVLVVDDSAVVRRLLTQALEREPDVTVVGTAADPFVARDLIVQHNPDVMTLDVEMPRMDGISFLRRVMAHRPMPVIIVSSVTTRGSAASVEALRLGAIDVIAKSSGPGSVAQISDQIVRRMRELRMGPRLRLKRLTAEIGEAPVSPPSAARHAGGLVLVGASTGGTQAIEAILTRLPADGPPVLIVQHMPAQFTKAFADRLDRVCAMHVVEAADGDSLKPGTAYVAPGDRHLEVARHGVLLRASLHDGRPLHYQRPSVDVLFQSAVRMTDVPIVATLLTGMGRDGAEGLRALRAAGAYTLAEDERSCVVFGMPREAIACGAVCRVATLFDMPTAIVGGFDRLRAVDRRPA